MTMPSGLWRLYRDGPFPRIQVLAGDSVAQRLESLAAVADSEILVVAGGLGNLENAIDVLRKVGVPCVYVLGTSELSGHDFSQVTARAHEMAKGSDVHVLEKSEAVIHGVRFLGATLWSSFADWKPELVRECLEHWDDLAGIDATAWWRNPENCIEADALCRIAELSDWNSTSTARAFHPAVAYAEHKESVRWLNEQLLRPFDGLTVVVSANAPVRASLAALKHYYPEDIDSLGWSGRKDRRANARLYAHANDLRGMMRQHRSNIDVWVHGGVAANSDIVSEGVRIVCRSGRRPSPDDDLPLGEILSRFLAKKHKRKRAGKSAKEETDEPATILHPRALEPERGLAEPLCMALLPVAESMAAHESAIRKLIPHTMAHSSIHRACVRRVIHEELMCVERLSRDASAQEEQVTGAQESFLSQLITCMYAFDTPTGYPKEMEEPKRFDYFKSVDQLAENIDAMRDVPLRALRQLVRWCDLAHSALCTMANRGLIGLVVRPPYEALRRPVGSYDISIVVDGSDTERQEIQKMLIAEYPRNDLSQPLMRVLTSAQPVNSNMVLLNLEQIKVVIENMTVSAGVSD